MGLIRLNTYYLINGLNNIIYIVIIINNMETETISYNKKYYTQNKERILTSIKEKIVCSCGKLESRGHITRHQKTKLHAKKLSELKLIE